jgi:hypothetical protein
MEKTTLLFNTSNDVLVACDLDIVSQFDVFKNMTTGILCKI